jgi:hypothetical protein
MSAPFSASFSSSRLSVAASRPTFGVRHLQRLCIGVHRDELDAGDPGVDHPVDGVRPAAADADDLDHG